MRYVPRLIGIAGRARAGKNTTATLLKGFFPSVEYAFADPIRKMLAAIGIDMNDPYWRERKEKVIPGIGKSPRQLMQTLGTEWGRDLVHPDFWLLLARQAYDRTDFRMIITDVRFENEVAWIRKEKGLMVFVDRPNGEQVSKHVSEHPLKREPEDIIINNSGSIEDLQHTIKKAFVKVYGR